MKCFNCGMENEDDAKYCKKCGNLIGFVPVKGNDNYPWYLSTWFIIIMFIYFFSIGIILFCKKYKINIIIPSIVFTIIVIFIYYSIKYIDSKFDFNNNQNAVNETVINDDEVDNVEQMELKNVIENENPINEIDELQIETMESYEDIEEEIEQDTEVESEFDAELEIETKTEKFWQRLLSSILETEQELGEELEVK